MLIPPFLTLTLSVIGLKSTIQDLFLLILNKQALWLVLLLEMGWCLVSMLLLTCCSTLTFRPTCCPYELPLDDAVLPQMGCKSPCVTFKPPFIVFTTYSTCFMTPEPWISSIWPSLTLPAEPTQLGRQWFSQLVIATS